MKKLKLSKKVQMIMITLLVITMGIIFVGILSNNNVNASGSKPVCPICTTSANMQYTGATEAGHTYVCSQHGQSKTESHAFSGGSCTLCGYKEAHTHNWKVLNRTSADASEHKVFWDCSGCTQTKTTRESHTFNSEGKCTLCGYSKQTSCAHSSTIVAYTYTATEHKMVNKCNACGATVSVIKTEPHSHDSSGNCVCGHFRNEYSESEICTCPSDRKTTTKSDSEYHIIECTGCGNFYFVKHNYQAVPATTTTSGHTTKCTGCGDVTAAVDCTFETEHDTQKHYVRCNVCGVRFVGAHQFGTPTSNDGTTHTLKCTIGAPYNCGYTKVESHTWGTSGAWTSNGNKTHSRQVTCSDGCGAQKTETADCVAAAGASTCSTCGANLGTGGGGETPSGGGTPGGDTEECEHTYEYKKDNNNHWEECTKCNDKKTSEAHKYGITADNGDGTHGSKCTVCEYAVKENHAFGNCTDNGDGTHNKECGTCKLVLKENHNYENGKCKECGAVEPKVECTHNYEIESNNTQHWEKCTKCNQVKDGSLETHIYTSYTNNNNDTHSSKCIKCEYEMTEQHNYENGKCSKCNAIGPNNDNTNDDNNNNNTNDNTNDNNNNDNTNDNNNNDNTNDDNNNDNTNDNNNDDNNNDNTNDSNNNNNNDSNNNNNNNSNNNNNNNNNNNSNNNNNNNDSTNANKDNTTAGKDIPKAGLKTSVLVIIVMFIVISLIAKQKMKKYKGI